MSRFCMQISLRTAPVIPAGGVGIARAAGMGMDSLGPIHPSYRRTRTAKPGRQSGGIAVLH